MSEEVQFDLKDLTLTELRRRSKQFRALGPEDNFDPCWLIYTSTEETLITETPIAKTEDMAGMFEEMSQELMRKEALLYVFSFEGFMDTSPDMENKRGIVTAIGADALGQICQCYRLIGTDGKSLGPIEWMDTVEPPVKPLGWFPDPKELN